MRIVVCVALLLVVLAVPAVAADVATETNLPPVTIEVIEQAEGLPELVQLLRDYLTWLVTPEEVEEVLEVDLEQDVLPEVEEIPDLAALFGSVEEVDSDGISVFSIGTQSAYPYTGGCFMAINTNYGTGVITMPEPYKVNTFGFIKGTNRVVNLTNSTINGYWIMGGTTYSLRFQRYGEAEYQYYSGSTYTWRTLTVSALTDSNVQFLDETGERGIQRPAWSLYERVVVGAIVIFGGALLLLVFLKRR